MLPSSFQTKLFINGEYVEAVKGKTFPCINPATGKTTTEISAATSEDVDLAVVAARKCLESEGWGYKSTGAQRAVVLRKIGEIITRRKDELALIESLDMGKPLRESLADMGDCISMCDHLADLAEAQDKKQNEVIENGTNGDFSTTIIHEPIGVIGAITPWNYPLLMAIWKVLPAIAAGCCIVLKPSELASLTCILLGEICNEAGLPAGALAVLPGLGPDAGSALSNHAGVDKMSFTGSVPTARKIMAAAALGPRAISLELGGKSPLIVFEDADIPSAVDWIMTGFVWGSGQVCSATSRVLVHPSLREPLLEQLVNRLSRVNIGDSLEPEQMNFQGPTMGPVVNDVQYQKILTYIREAEEGEGLTCLYGGMKALPKLQEVVGTAGFFIPPTVFVDVPIASKVWKEEIFGPVVCIREFQDEADAIFEANNTVYGLAAAVFSADAERCDRVTRALRVGVVWKNCCQPAFIQAPWGGVKQSGFGRELGKWGLEEFTAIKQVTGCAVDFNWGVW